MQPVVMASDQIVGGAYRLIWVTPWRFLAQGYPG